MRNSLPRNRTTILAAASAVLETYEAVIGLSTSTAPVPRAGTTDTQASTVLAVEARRMRNAFASRTGSFGPDDPWFETRTRAFWDDALTFQRFAGLAAPCLDETMVPTARWFQRAHRGLFSLRLHSDARDETPFHLIDVWSGAELMVFPLDHLHSTSMRYADGLIDGRVVAFPSGDSAINPLFLLPGYVHHASDVLHEVHLIVNEARKRRLRTHHVLDALMQMELTRQRSARVKAAFAYRVDCLPHP